MAFDDNYKRQAELLVDVLSFMDWNGVFALKGGTAINLFYNNMPRLSVDIDLVYLPIKNREASILDMNEKLQEIAQVLTKSGYQTSTSKTYKEQLHKLNVMKDNTSIIIEPNYTIRGTVLPPKKKVLVPAAIEYFDRKVTALCIDDQEVYSGKMVAFLDRQHPRDLFDMMEYYQNEKTLAPIMDLLMVYLIQGDRLFTELLNPNLKDVRKEFDDSFTGMTSAPVEYSSLTASRNTVLADFGKSLNKKHLEFLTSVMNLDPDWSKLPYGDLSKFPGINWKLQNIEKMTSEKRKAEIEKIHRFFQDHDKTK